LKTKILVADHQAFSKHPSSVLRVLENLGPGVVLAEFNSGGDWSRQVDVLFANEYGLHLIELKGHSGPITAESNGPWLVNGKPMANGKNQESPPDQAVNTSDKLKKRLHRDWAQPHGIKEFEVLPWIVLVNTHPNSRFEGRQFPDVVHGGRRCWIVNGIANLKLEDLNKRAQYGKKDEKKICFVSSALKDLESCIGVGFTAPDEGRIWGQLLDSQTKNGAPQVNLTAQRRDCNFRSPPTTTDKQGCFAFDNLKPGEYDLIFSLPNEYSEPKQVQVSLLPGFKIMPPILLYRSGEIVEERDQLSQEKQDQATLEQSKQFESDSKSLREENKLLSERIETLEVELEKSVSRREQVQIRNTQGGISSGAPTVDIKALERLINDQTVELTNNRELLLMRAKRSVQLEFRASHMQRQLPDNQQRFTRAMTVSALVGTVGGILSLQPLPGPDIVILTPLQVGLVMSISRIYGREMTQDMVVKIIAALGAGMVGQHATVLLYKLIPGAWALGAITVPATFVALGWATAKFLERGTMPSNAERKDVMVRIKNALTDPVLLKEAKETASSVVQEFRSQGASSLKPETIRDIFEGVSRDHPELGKRLSDHLNAPKKPKDTD
jgi:uncharacterized protein (DUF697 family)